MNIESLIDAFSRHHRLRLLGKPVVTTIMGPPVRGRWQWVRWCETLGRRVAACFEPMIDRVYEAWLELAVDDVDLFQDALNRFAEIEGLASERVRGVLADLPIGKRSEIIRKSFAGRESSPLDRLFSAMLVDDRRENGPGLVAWGSPLVKQDHQGPYQGMVAAMLALKGEGAPAIWMEPAGLSAAVDALGRVAEQFPQIPIGWAVEPWIFKAYDRQTPDSRAKAICREGMVFGAVIEEKAGAGKNEAIEGPCGGRPERSLTYLAAGGATPELVDSFIALAEKITAGRESGPEESEKARSLAEKFLYDRLESMEKTAGRFLLNERLPIAFGTRGYMEVDLLSHDDRLAVEIDGYYHFGDQAAYRRDRRKDYLLQKHGYLIIRFYAEDIVADLENILNTILDAMIYRETALVDERGDADG